MKNSCNLTNDIILTGKIKINIFNHRKTFKFGFIEKYMYEWDKII